MAPTALKGVAPTKLAVIDIVPCERKHLICEMTYHAAVHTHAQHRGARMVRVCWAFLRSC
jgi:hypothetical protein